MISSGQSGSVERFRYHRSLGTAQNVDGILITHMSWRSGERKMHLRGLDRIYHQVVYLLTRTVNYRLKQSMMHSYVSMQGPASTGTKNQMTPSLHLSHT